VSRPIFVYLSAADTEEDRAWRRQVELHLKPLVRRQQIRIQHRECLSAGEEPSKRIPDLVEATDIFIPLLSASYLDDEIAYEIELATALRRREQHRLRIWPIKAAAVAVPEGDPAAVLQKLVGFPRASNVTLAALAKTHQVDEVLASLAKELGGVMKLVEGEDSAARSIKRDLIRTGRDVAALGPIRNRFALVIGVDHFADAPSLKFCTSDAKQLASRLQALNYCVRSLYEAHEDGVRSQPTRQNIERALVAASKSAGEEDLLFVHVGTHGTVLPSGKPILLAQDTYLESLESTGIPIATIEELLHASAARRVVLSLDACHSGIDPMQGKRALGDPATSAAEFYAKVYEAAEGFAVIAACTSDQFAYEDLEAGYGVYTHFLMEALEGSVAISGSPSGRDKGFVTLDDVKKHVLARMREWCFLKNKKPQEPNVRSQIIGDLILADYRSPAA